MKKNTGNSIIVVRNFLIIFIALSLIYLVFVSLSSVMGWHKVDIAAVENDIENSGIGLNIKKYEDIESLTGSKKVFFNPATTVNVITPVSPVASAVPVKVPEIPIEEIAQNYSLVAVLNGANPQAIIADKKNDRTHYLYKGQSIGDVKVQEIEDKKVILNHKGRTFELFL